MNRFFKILLFLVILGLAVYQFQDVLGLRFFSHLPCAEPIPYALGDFDQRFNISEGYFLDAVLEAEAIWEEPFGRNLFAYEAAGSDGDILKINLIYDYRQQATSKLASLGIVVKESKASYDMLRAKLAALKEEYEKEKNIFAVRLAAFYQRQKTFETAVNFWNKKGDAPEKEYNALEAERLVLEAEARELKILQNEVNEIVDEINALVVVLNRLADTLNLSVEKYNTINVARGESFEEGVYQSDGRTRAIDIYEFSSRAKLVRVLAHELGHALDLPHVADSTAIMYEFNQGDNMKLSDTDLKELEVKCGTSAEVIK